MPGLIAEGVILPQSGMAVFMLGNHLENLTFDLNNTRKVTNPINMHNNSD